MHPFKGKNGVLLIAEVGGNHEGDFDEAIKLAGLAIDAGADVVKYQVYTGETLVSKGESPERVKHFDRFALTLDQYEEVARYCQQRGARFNASIWDAEAFDRLDQYIDFYKIGSGDLTAFPVLKEIAGRGKPIILSTGLSSLAEVREAVNFLQECNSDYVNPSNLMLLQCTSMYPIPDEDANLNVIPLLQSEFGVPVGYSDHTVGTSAAEVAVTMGASALELHFTDQREGRDFRDHQVSFLPQELSNLILRIKQIKTLQGDGCKEPTPSEIKSGHVESFRRAMYFKRDMKAGEIIHPDDLIALRPNRGVDARNYKDLIDKALVADVKAFMAIDLKDVDL